MDTSELVMKITNSLRVVFQIEAKQLKIKQRKQNKKYRRQIETLK